MFTFDDNYVLLGWSACTIFAIIAFSQIGFGCKFSLTHWLRRRKIEKWKKENQPVNFAVEMIREFDTKNSSKKFERYQFIGCESDGTCLLIDFTAMHDNQEAYLYLKLADGRIFTLPTHPQAQFATRNKFNGALSVDNLRFEILVPHSKWRITYNGLLRLHTANNAEQYHHVIFTFFWNAASDPITWPNHWSTQNIIRLLNGNHINNEKTLDKWLSAWQGFDQCGAMIGQVTIDSENSVDGVTKEMFEVNLPGVRRIRFGDVSSATTIVGHSPANVTVIGSGDDGCVFAVSTDNETCFGFVRWPNGDILPIERSELDTKRFMATEPNDVINIHFSTPKRMFSPSLRRAKDSSIQLFGVKRQTKTTIFAMSTELNGFKFNGLVLCQQPVSQVDDPKNLATCSAHQEVYPSFEPSIRCDNTKLSIPFDCLECQNEELCGGKGSSLGFLTLLSRQTIDEFLVPDGFVLTSASFNLQLKCNAQLNTAISSLENIAYQRSNGSLQDACVELTDLFKSIDVHTEIVTAVRNELETLRIRANSAAFKLAIRSSAIGEDGAASSSAGQNETFLAVDSDLEHVTDAIRKCWASLFSYRSVVYRVQNIQPIRSAMAVAIQSMIPSEAAGVLFTHFPLDDDPNKLLITANFGLGESVVSGKIDPDVFVVRRRQMNGESGLSILDRKLGSKEHRIEMNENGQASVRNAQHNEYSISDRYALQLSKIGAYLEHCYGTPRDIEWAIHQNKVYLLQSRPMTSTTSFTSWELLHEFDSAIMSRNELCTFANIGEVMPDALCPLTISTIMSSINRTSMTQINPGKVASPLYNLFMTISHWRVAINVFDVLLHHVEPKISLTMRVLALTVFGHEIVDDEMHKFVLHRNGLAAMNMRLLWDMIKSAWNNKTVSRKCKLITDTFRGTYDSVNLTKFTDSHALYDDITKNVIGMDYVTYVHSHTSKISSLYQLIAFHTLAEGNTEISNEVTSDIALILSSCTDVESAEIPVMLEETTNFIFNSGKHSEFISIDANEGVDWLKTNCSEAYELLQTFLQRHGHRAYAEFDLASTTWDMKPSLVMEMLQCASKSLRVGHKKEAKIRMNDDEILTALKSPKRSLSRKLLKMILPHFKTSVQLRERSKSCQVAYIHELRKAYRFLAHKMKQNGLLSHPELIFFLTHTEIGLVLNKNRIDLVLKAQRRCRIYADCNKNRFDELQRGVPQPMSDKIMIDTSAIHVKGTVVCCGNINARACVVRHFSEVSKINAGDIMITHCTDIAWSPYFPMLAGIVTELGGLVSHGAVVAREYGLPCIVGATNATTFINDGDYINMDAYTGIITKIVNDDD